MAKLVNKSLVDLAEEEILKAIDTGRVEPGSRISIASFAREFGTSIVPVREALARLLAQRILRFEPNKGYSVVPSPNLHEVMEMLDARLAYEVGSIELLVETISNSQIDRLASINEKVSNGTFDESVEGFRKFAKLNAEFHRSLIVFTGNRFLLDGYDAIGYHKLIARTLRGRGVHDISMLAEEHDRIVKALRSRDKHSCQNELIGHIVGASRRLPELDGSN